MPQATRTHSTPAPRLPRALTPAARKLIDDAMAAHWLALEGLTAFLDASDDDPDIEPDGSDEPSLGGSGRIYDGEGDDPLDAGEITAVETHGRGFQFCAGAFDDSEPSLAHGTDFNQLAARANLNSENLRSDVWSASGDLEEECEDEGSEHDGREPDVDDEPSLGALLNHERQTGWANSGTEDLEDALAHG